MKSPGHALRRLGQSLWLDYLHRGLLRSGELKRLIDADGISGITTNPTIFDKAICETGLYDEDIAQLSTQGLNDHQIYQRLVVADVQAAADLLYPLYEATGHVDGYVSVEVSPALAYDTQGTIRAAEELWSSIGRPNVLIKIPGTREGLPAIEHCLQKGININITLLFSVQRYEEVAWLYIRALESRQVGGLSLEGVASVASFFVSRVDTWVDKELERLVAEGGLGADEAQHLTGRAGIANAKLAYQRFLAIFSHPRFCRLAEMGARVQRPLWASTSTKNPNYSDVMYVEGLIGPDTVNTVPPVTLDAFRDHGETRPTLTEGVDEAQYLIDRLGELGIDIEEVARQLEHQGVELFAQSYEHTISSLARRRQELTRPGLRRG